AALVTRPRLAPPADLVALEQLALNSNYQLPEDPALHGLGTDVASWRIASVGSLYPDQVIFLSDAITIARPGDTARDLEQPSRVLLIFPSKGVLVARHASAGALSMIRGLADVASRISPATNLRVLTDAECAELLGWDAEKYRQSLNSGKRNETP
ncbi:MAG: class II aldolase, partial [Verrucomicrobiota bacterium]